MRKISSMFVHGWGFSKGWDELPLKKPPPLVPSSLMTSWEATGPPGMIWSPPAMPVTCMKPMKFCAAPPTMSRKAPTAAIGMRMRRVVRVRSTQKLPMVCSPRPTNPRTRAIATAMPVAAETKFCTHRPASWTKCPRVASGE